MPACRSQGCGRPSYGEFTNGLIIHERAFDASISRKKASLVSFAEVLNFISLSVILETPKAIAKIRLERHGKKDDESFYF